MASSVSSKKAIMVLGIVAVGIGIWYFTQRKTSASAASDSPPMEGGGAGGDESALQDTATGAPTPVYVVMAPSGSSGGYSSPPLSGTDFVRQMSEPSSPPRASSPSGTSFQVKASDTLASYEDQKVGNLILDAQRLNKKTEVTGTEIAQTMLVNYVTNPYQLLKNSVTSNPSPIERYNEKMASGSSASSGSAPKSVPTGTATSSTGATAIYKKTSTFGSSGNVGLIVPKSSTKKKK